jgi:DNA-binding IclR family transcriptional regulator
VLAALEQHPMGVTATELADALGRSHSDIAKTLEALEAKGLARHEGEWRNIYVGRAEEAPAEFREKHGLGTLLFFAVPQ